MSEYFTLTDSAGTSKRFRVVQGGYRPSLDKAQSVNRGLDGTPDIAQGSVWEQHQYVVKVYAEDPDGSDYGTLDDLKDFYRLNNPIGTPSSELVLTTHYDEQYTVAMLGTFDQDLLSVMIEGINSVWIVQVTFLFIGAVVS